MWKELSNPLAEDLCLVIAYSAISHCCVPTFIAVARSTMLEDVVFPTFRDVFRKAFDSLSFATLS